MCPDQGAVTVCGGVGGGYRVPGSPSVQLCPVGCGARCCCGGPGSARPYVLGVFVGWVPEGAGPG